MNPSAYRKVAYMAALVALLFPMAWLGSPSSRGGPGEPDDPGGKLAQLRAEAKLGQYDLGAIDPASETMRMATLGLRGPAVTMLWNKANEYKKTEDWTAFQATLEQLARLQPYFVKVWQYQAWNLSYNVSVELDAVKDRFYYVKQGIKYLKDGIVYLRDNPTLLDDLGWFCGNKVGRADEHTLYRKMFKLDDELHEADVPMADRDNWLVSRRWYEEAIRPVDNNLAPLGTKNPVTFFDSPARSQMSYAEAIEEEGAFLNLWKSAWQEGGRLWKEYGDRKMRSVTGLEISLGEQEALEAHGKELSAQLDALSPGLMAKMRAEATASLTPQQQKLIASPPSEPTEDESQQQMLATEVMNVTPQKVADRIANEQPEHAAEARRISAEIADNTERINSISTNRDVANYTYWRIRCGLEQTDEALEARTLIHGAEDAFKKGDLDGSREKYEQSFVLWQQALDKFPELDADSTFGDDLMDFVAAYVKVLEQLDLSLEDRDVADRFGLWKIVEANDNERKYTAALTARDERRTGMPANTKPMIEVSEGFVQ